MNHIPLDHPMLIDILARIPAKFHSRMWVAGSAATRWPEAWEAGGDLDLWMCGIEWMDRDQLFSLFPANIIPRREQPDEEYNSTATMLIREPRLHVLMTDESIDNVLAAFDISTHCGAVNIVTGEVIDRSTQAVQITQWRDPRRTLQRALRFAHRYHDNDIWNHPKTLECVQAAFKLPRIPRDQLDRVMQLVVPDGL